MRDTGLRYHYRIFNQMAEFLKTRNSMQCKSHHQKMLKKNDNCIENIIFKSNNPNNFVKIGDD
jgi:hypothetical protein